MTGRNAKAELHRYLQAGRDAVLWKLDGLSGYDIRRPLVPTGTNLLGLVKHLAGVELGYFGDTFGRPEEFPDGPFSLRTVSHADHGLSVPKAQSQAEATEAVVGAVREFIAQLVG
jgi:hypothetical protein